MMLLTQVLHWQWLAHPDDQRQIIKPAFAGLFTKQNGVFAPELLGRLVQRISTAKNRFRCVRPVAQDCVDVAIIK